MESIYIYIADWDLHGIKYDLTKTIGIYIFKNGDRMRNYMGYTKSTM